MAPEKSKEALNKESVLSDGVIDAAVNNPQAAFLFSGQPAETLAATVRSGLGGKA